MPGANRPLDVVPLASHRDDFVILARFPAGFVRDVPGGYHAAETFLVLGGGLVLDGHAVGRGDLTHVPAGLVRSDMRTDEGCLALAWFSGPADYLPPDVLGAVEGDIRTVRVDGTEGVVLRTPEAEWVVGETASGESVDLALTRWSALSVEGESAPGLVRLRR
jgi:hypothetical protein